MDALRGWAYKIAEEVVPDEVDLAPEMAIAYAQGGKSRKELFSHRDGTAGGFGGEGLAALFPWILQGISAAGPSVLSLVTSGPVLKDLITVLKDSLSLKEALVREKKIARLPANPYTHLKSARMVIIRELESAPVPIEDVDYLALKILHALLEDPQGSQVFIEKAGAKPDG
jgi:hypothetical protein